MSDYGKGDMGGGWTADGWTEPKPMSDRLSDAELNSLIRWASPKGGTVIGSWRLQIHRALVEVQKLRAEVESLKFWAAASQAELDKRASALAAIDKLVTDDIERHAGYVLDDIYDLLHPKG